MDDVINTVGNIATSIKGIAPALAGVALIIIGLMWMLAKDPQKKESLVGWITNVVIGFGVVYLGTSLVEWLKVSVVGFK